MLRHASMQGAEVLLRLAWPDMNSMLHIDGTGCAPVACPHIMSMEGEVHCTCARRHVDTQ